MLTYLTSIRIAILYRHWYLLTTQHYSRLDIKGKKKMASLSSRNLIACCQMTSTADKEQNRRVCKDLIENAAKSGAKVVFLPECFDYIGRSKEESLEMAEYLDGPTVKFYQNLCKENGVWLSLGGFHRKGSEGGNERLYNTHILLDERGQIKQTYDKVHLFSVAIKGVTQSETNTIAGKEVPEPVQTPVGKIGLQICYDVRFPEESIIQTKLGAEILTYPSAFTVVTGMAHWEVLLRARAIENQCYVVGATQTGQHHETRQSYGHAMVVDPWGAVIAQATEGTGYCLAHIDLDYLTAVREKMPVMSHRESTSAIMDFLLNDKTILKK